MRKTMITNPTIQSIAATALFFLSLIGISAQEKREDAEAVRSVKITTVCPVAIKGLSTWYAPASPMPEDPTTYKGNWVKLKLNRFTPLGPFQLKARKDIPIYSEPDATQKPAHLVSIADSSDDLLLFFIGNPKEKKHELVLADNASIKKGSFYIINKTKFPLGFQIGDVKESVPAGKANTITPGEGGKDAKVYIRRDGTELLRSTRWFIKKDQREFVLFLGEPLRWLHVVDSRKKIAQPNKEGETK